MDTDCKAGRTVQQKGRKAVWVLSNNWLLRQHAMQVLKSVVTLKNAEWGPVLDPCFFFFVPNFQFFSLLYWNFSEQLCLVLEFLEGKYCSLDHWVAFSHCYTEVDSSISVAHRTKQHKTVSDFFSLLWLCGFILLPRHDLKSCEFGI